MCHKSAGPAPRRNFLAVVAAGREGASRGRAAAGASLAGSSLLHKPRAGERASSGRGRAVPAGPVHLPRGGARRGRELVPSRLAASPGETPEPRREKLENLGLGPGGGA